MLAPLLLTPSQQIKISITWHELSRWTIEGPNKHGDDVINVKTEPKAMQAGVVGILFGAEAA